MKVLDTLKGLWARLFHNEPKVRLIIALFVLAFLGAAATTCRGMDVPAPFVAPPTFSTRVESGSTYVRGMAPTLALTFASRRGTIGKDGNYEFGLALVGDSLDRGVYVGSNFGLHAAACDGYRKVDLCLGAVYLQNVDRYNGSHVNFNLGLRYWVTPSIYLGLTHWSNAGTVKPNKGRDFIRIGYVLN